MKIENAALTFVSGIDIGFTSTLYHAIKERVSRLQALFPGRKFKFVGNPFKGWKHPLLKSAEHRRIDARAKLFRGWDPFAQHLSEIATAIEDGYTIIGLRGGFDLLSNATACLRVDARDDEEWKKILQRNVWAEDMHHDWIVPGVVKTELETLPNYQLVCADPEEVKDDWLRESPALKDKVGRKEICTFIRQESELQKRYFDPKHGQREPIRIKASPSIEDMFEQALKGFASIYL